MASLQDARGGCRRLPVHHRSDGPAAATSAPETPPPTRQCLYGQCATIRCCTPFLGSTVRAGSTEKSANLITCARSSQIPLRVQRLPIQLSLTLSHALGVLAVSGSRFPRWRGVNVVCRSRLPAGVERWCSVTPHRPRGRSRRLRLRCGAPVPPLHTDLLNCGENSPDNMPHD